MQTRLMSRSEAAEYAGMTLYMINRLIKDGAIIVVRIYGRVYVHRDRFDEWIDSAASLSERNDSIEN